MLNMWMCQLQKCGISISSQKNITPFCDGVLSRKMSSAWDVCVCVWLLCVIIREFSSSNRKILFAARIWAQMLLLLFYNSNNSNNSNNSENNRKTKSASFFRQTTKTEKRKKTKTKTSNRQWKNRKCVTMWYNLTISR